MKKLMISMAVAMLTTVGFANATTNVDKNRVTVSSVTQDKVEVKPEELPEAVKATLNGAPYSEWKVEKAYLVPGENGTSHFEINVSKGEETSTIKLDNEGKVID
ncbi:MAG: hypothetical protein WCY86_06315 [Spirosomataceae bacterium]